MSSIRFAVIDGCPCPRPMKPLLKKLKKETGCTFESIYRGDDALALLHKNGKHSQRELAEATPAERAAWGVLGTPNPAGQSTHELFSDGVAYPGPIGRKLLWWQCGLDIDDAHVQAVIVAAKRHGWTLKRPYGAGVEYHHCNFTRKPSRWKAFFRNFFGPKKPAPKPKVAPAKPAPKHEPKVKVTKTKTGHEASITVHKHPAKKTDHLGSAIDVSEAQGDIDWKKVGGNVKVAFCKATEGTTFTDSRFTGARLKAMQANVRAGVYHFARPDDNRPTAEVKHFVETVHAAGGKFISYKDWKAGKPGLLGVLDFETAPFSAQWAIAWGKAFEKETGVKAMLYGYGSSLNPVLGAVKHFCGIWFAAYVSDWKPYLNAHHDRVRFWQDSDKSSCPGVSGAVDHSQYLG